MLNGAASMSHPEGYKSPVDETGTSVFKGLQDSVNCFFIFFYSLPHRSFMVAVNDFPASIFSVL